MDDTRALEGFGSKKQSSINLIDTTISEESANAIPPIPITSDDSPSIPTHSGRSGVQFKRSSLFHSSPSTSISRQTNKLSSSSSTTKSSKVTKRSSMSHSNPSSATEEGERMDEDTKSVGSEDDEALSAPKTVKTILDSYIELNSKNMSKINQPPKDPAFLLKPHTPKPSIHSKMSSSEHQKAIDPILNQNKKLIGNNAILDQHQTPDTALRKTGEVISNQIKPGTIIINNISELKVETPYQKRNVVGEPGLFTLNTTILPNYQENKDKAKQALDSVLSDAIAQRVLMLPKSDIVLPASTENTSTSKTTTTTNTKVYRGTSVTSIETSSDAMDDSSSSSSSNNPESSVPTPQLASSAIDQHVRAVIISFNEIMEKIADDFYNSSDHTSVSHNAPIYDAKYIKNSLNGTFEEHFSTNQAKSSSYNSTVDSDGFNKPHPLHRNPNLRVPTSEDTGTGGDNTNSGQLTLDIPRLSRQYIMNYLRAPCFPHERPCRRGQMCEGYALWLEINSNTPVSRLNAMQNTNPHKLSETPFALREFFLPKEVEAMMEKKRLGKTYSEIMSEIKPRICYLCNLLYTQQLTNYQKAGVEKRPWFHIQNHGVICDAPGEYKREFIRGCNGEWCGIITQTLSYNRDHYTLGNYYVWSIEVPQKRNVGGGLNEPFYKCHTTPISFSSAQKTSGNTSSSNSTNKVGQPSTELVSSVCDLFGTTDGIEMQVVPGFLEIEDIIFQPEVNNSHVRNLMETVMR
jgi:hypothetical protein